MQSLFVLWCAVVLEVAFFFLARYVVAGAIGLRGRAARVGFAPEAWHAVPIVPRIAFAAAGPFACYLVAAACFALSLSLGGETRADPSTMRVTAAPGGPAEASGVEEGDRVVTVDGAPVGDWPSLRARLQAHAGGEPVALGVERGGRRMELRPVVGAAGRIGVSPFREHTPVGAGRAIVSGLGRPFDVLGETFRAVFRPRGSVEVMGPVGVLREVSKTSRDVAPVASALGMAGALLSYFIGVPVLVAGILFPRARRR